MPGAATQLSVVGAADPLSAPAADFLVFYLVHRVE